MADCMTDQDLAAFVGGTASPEKTAAWKRHLETCAECSERLADTRAEAARRSTAAPGEEAPTPAGFRPGTKLGDFEIERQIGVGGMGIVYQARQLSLNRKVALKVLPRGLGMTQSAVTRFHQEARAAAKLHHTNIVAIYAEGEEDGTCFYAMELIEGRGVDTVIAEQRRVKAAQQPGSDSGAHREHYDTIARWIADIAEALDYAHKQGVIHRDVKPSNLMVDQDDRLKLMDFGLARMLEEPGMTVTGEFLGTPRYMSPEQIAVGRMRVDHRTDIYSLGATIYELLTLRPPFPGHHRDEIIAQIMTKEVRPPRRVDKRIPVDLETVCQKAIEKDPDRRYQSAREMAEDLRRFVNRYAIAARRIGPIGKAVRFVRRHKLAVTAAVLVVASTLAALGLAWRYRALETRMETERLLAETQKLHAEGRYQDALAAARVCLERDPSQLEARLIEARILIDMDRPDTAALERLALQHPDEGAVHYLLARVYQDVDQTVAGRHRRRAGELAPDTPDAYHLRALTAGDLDQSVELLSSALRLEPRHYASLRSRSLVNLALREFTKAESDARSMILLRPKDPQAFTLRAGARRGLGRLEEAIEDLTEAVRLASDNADLLDQRCECYVALDRFHEALADARRSVELAPHRVEFRFKVFACLVLMQDFEAADQECTEIVASAPGNAAQLYQLARHFVFDRLAAGQPVELPPKPASEIFAQMREAAHAHTALSARARRIVPVGFTASWSPDGKQLAYSRGMPGSNGVEIMDLDSGKTRVVAIPGKDPAWSPDGKHIAYVRDRQLQSVTAIKPLPYEARLEANFQEEIWITPSTGGTWRRLCRGRRPAWSPDATTIYFNISKEDGTLYSIEVDKPNAKPVAVVPCPAAWPAVSPDARYVAYPVGREARVVDLSSGETVVSWTSPTSLHSVPTWSPDSKEVMLGAYIGGGLWMLDIRTGEAVNVLFGITALVPALSPDRSRMAFDRRGWPFWEIWLAELPAGVSTAEALGPVRTPEEFELHRYTVAIESNPESSDAYYRRGRHVHQKAKRWEAAIRDYSTAIELDKEKWPAWRNRAWCRENLRRWQEAIADYSRVLELKPYYTGVWRRRAFCHRVSAQWEKAAADYTKMLEFDPTFTAGYQHRAFAFMFLNRLQECIADLERADQLLESQGYPAEACNRQAWFWMIGPTETRRPAEALRLAGMAVEKEPGSRSYKDTLGVAQYRNDRLEDALQTLTEVVAGPPDAVTPGSYFFLAMIAHKLGQTDKARAYYGEAEKTWQEVKEQVMPSGETILKSLRDEAALLLGSR